MCEEKRRDGNPANPLLNTPHPAGTAGTSATAVLPPTNGGENREVQFEPDAHFYARHDCPVSSPLAWLEGVKSYPKFYWQSRDGQLEVAVAGAVLAFRADGLDQWRVLQHNVQTFFRNSGQNVWLFGGQRFSFMRKRGREWQLFPMAYFFLPRFMLVRQGNLCSGFVYRSRGGRKSGKFPEGVQQWSDWPEAGRSRKAAREDRPDYRSWIELTEQLLEAIREGRLEKTVLARRTRLRFSSVPNPFQILHTLQKRNERCFAFLFQPEKGRAFLGVTPERLFRHSGRFVETEAVSGTAGRGASPAKDRILGEMLLESRKNRREHQFVVDWIRQRLMRFGQVEQTDGSPKLLRLKNVQHLYTPFRCEIGEEVSPLDLLGHLHPTPAVAGVPFEPALEAIRRLEPFDRGWYAGPVGILGSRFSEIAVAIRSALVTSRSVYFYAGAGIVEGSDPAMEWEELEKKISIALELLGVQGGS